MGRTLGEELVILATMLGRGVEGSVRPVIGESGCWVEPVITIFVKVPYLVSEGGYCGCFDSSLIPLPSKWRWEE